MLIKVQEPHRTPSRLYQKRKPQYMIGKTLNILKKEGILEAARGKSQVPYKG